MVVSKRKSEEQRADCLSIWILLFIYLDQEYVKMWRKTNRERHGVKKEWDAFLLEAARGQPGIKSVQVEEQKWK